MVLLRPVIFGYFGYIVTSTELALAEPRPWRVGIGIFVIVAAVVAEFASVRAMIQSEYVLLPGRIRMKTVMIRTLAIDLPYSEVKGIVVQKGIMGKAFGYGNVIVQQLNGKQHEFANLRKPEELRDRAMRQMRTRQP